MDLRIFFLPIVGFLIVAVNGWWFVRPVDFAFVIASVALLHIAASWWLDHWRRDWWSFAILPILLNWSAFSYALILSNQRFTIFILLLSIILTIIYWRLIFLYVFKHTAYKPFSLERFAPYLSFVTVFFASASAYGLKTFLDIPQSQLVLIMIVFQLGIVHQWLWAHKVEWKNGWRYALAFILIITELFFVFDLLPLDFNILGFMLASTWYALSGIVAAHVSGRLTAGRLRLILGIIFGSWLIILVTARWF